MLLLHTKRNQSQTRPGQATCVNLRSQVGGSVGQEWGNGWWDGQATATALGGKLADKYLMAVEFSTIRFGVCLDPLDSVFSQSV